MKAAYNERIQWSGNRQGRGGKRARYGVGHTQEGNGTAASLANYLCRPAAQASYHNVIDNERNVVALVDTDLASWSVGNANNVCINYCYAGSRAGWSRDEWLSNMANAIEVHAWLWVVDARKYGLPAGVVSHADIKAGKLGATDHNGINLAYLRSPGHWDCGPNYPWDVFADHVERFRAFLAGELKPAEPEPTAIESCRAANEWLGDRVTAEPEVATPDGVGRFAEFAGGWVYWYPTLGAFAIPPGLFGVYARHGWETGPGYPVGPSLRLLEYRRSLGTVVPGGAVQAFERGTLYLEDGKDSGYLVGGTIREFYRTVGYEGGALGWPVSDESDWSRPAVVDGARADVVVGRVQYFEHGAVYWVASTNQAYGVTRDGVPVAPGL